MATVALSEMASSARHKAVVVLTCVQKSIPPLPYSDAPPRTEPLLPDHWNIGRGTGYKATSVPTLLQTADATHDWYIDSDLARLYRALKLAGRGTRLCKDCSTVSVRVLVDEFDCLI